jgi:SAM-dependent methyltransferase
LKVGPGIFEKSMIKVSMPPACNERVYAGSNQPLLQLIAPFPAGSALDCGCGTGGNARGLSQMGWRVTGITVSPRELEMASEWCEAVLLGDLNSGIPREVGGPFDLVVFSHVLEHLLHPEVALREAHRLLTPDGRLIVALPNVLYWRMRLKFLFGEFKYEPTGIMDETHVRFYTFQSGMELLRSNGFEILSTLGDGDLPIPFLRRLLPPLARRLDPLASRLVPGLLGAQILYVARVARL